MRRRSDDNNDKDGSSAGSSIEAGLGRFLERNPRFFLYLTITLVGLLAVGIVIAKLLGEAR